MLRQYFLKDQLLRNAWERRIEGLSDGECHTIFNPRNGKAVWIDNAASVDEGYKDKMEKFSGSVRDFRAFRASSPKREWKMHGMHGSAWPTAGFHRSYKLVLSDHVACKGVLKSWPTNDCHGEPDEELILDEGYHQCQSVETNCLDPLVKPEDCNEFGKTVETRWAKLICTPTHIDLRKGKILGNKQNPGNSMVDFYDTHWYWQQDIEGLHMAQQPGYDESGCEGVRGLGKSHYARFLGMPWRPGRKWQDINDPLSGRCVDFKIETDVKLKIPWDGWTGIGCNIF